MTRNFVSAISRREFLRLTSLSAAGLAVPVRWLEPEKVLGRVVQAQADIYRDASYSSTRIGNLVQDQVVPIDAAIVGDNVPPYNRVWYWSRELGYLHSSLMQPVRNDLNRPLKTVPYRGQLMEVSVPYADAHTRQSADEAIAYRFYYQSTMWANGVSLDPHNHVWYRIPDDKFEQEYYVRAELLRPIPPGEIAPLSTDVAPEDKLVEVSLSQQWIRCYEGVRLVYTTKASTGQQRSNGDYWTPQGEFMTFRKRPSRHMAVGNLASGYDLPGVPWVSYITDDGVSFHGTYWHNDFGAPRSHGCINLPPHAAKWLYRWTMPAVPANQQEVWGSTGTRVLIHL